MLFVTEASAVSQNNIHDKSDEYDVHDFADVLALKVVVLETALCPPNCNNVITVKLCIRAKIIVMTCNAELGFRLNIIPSNLNCEWKFIRESAPLITYM